MDFSIASIHAFFAGLTLSKLLPAILTLLIGLVVVKILLRLFDKAGRHSKMERTLLTFLRAALRILLVAIVVLIAASRLGVDVTSLVALLSVVSLALSLAVQGVLSNLAGGLQILTTRPFKAGDFIECGGISGSVAGIDLVYTKIVTVDNKEVFVPNSEISAKTIINYTADTMRRVDLNFTASYNCSVDDVKAALEEAIGMVSTVVNDPPVFVRVSSYLDSSIEYVTRTWTKTEDYWTTYFDITENVKKVFDARGIEFAYPHVDVLLRK